MPMRNSIRVSAKTVDDAITDAMIQLGVTSDRLEYEVIEKGSSGFLGIGMKQAVIDAWKKEEAKVPFSKKSDSVEVKHKPEISSTERIKPDKPVKPPVVKTEKPEIEPASKENLDKEEGFKKEEKAAVTITQETILAVKNFLEATLKAMGLKVEVFESIDKDNVLCFDMKGENMGLIIGKRGQTLDSLQYLANRVANKYQAEYIRVKLDTENYRARREETLNRLAKNLANKVKRTRRPVSLEPMNPYERRIIHSVLQSNPYVSTHSEGDEPYRKVVITLKR